MQADLARVHIGEEVAAQHRVEQAGQQAKTEKKQDEALAVREGGRQGQRVGPAHMLKLRVKTSVQPLQQAGLGVCLGCFVHPAHQQHDQGWNQGTRQEVRRDHGKYNGHRQRNKQEACNPGQEKHRHKNNADAQGGHKSGRADFRSTHFDGIVEFLAQMQVPLYVFNCDNGLVNQDAERHEIERLTQRKQRQDGGQDRKGNRQRDDDGAAPVAKEQQDHQGRQPGGDQGFSHHAQNSRFHKHRLIKQGCDLDVGGQGLNRFGKQGLDVCHDVQRRGTAIFQHRDEHATKAVLPDHIGLGLKSVPDIGYIPQVSGGVVQGPHRQIVELGQNVG